MSCPAWEPLVAARDHEPGADPAGWRDALDHFDGCPACRRRALALDPTLLFRGLPAPPEEAIDLPAMQEAVASLVRARRIERSGSAPRRSWWRRAAVAAAVLVALGVEAGPRRPGAPGVESAAAGANTPALVMAPVFEHIDRPEARVYQLPTEGFSVVMIVDSSFDV